MIETYKENLQEINLNNYMSLNTQLKDQLLSEDTTKHKKNEDKNILDPFPKLGNEETTYTENIEEELFHNMTQNNDYTPSIELKNENIINKEKKENIQNVPRKSTDISIDECNKNDLTDTTIQVIKDSNINRESFVNKVKQNKEEIDKKKKEQNIKNISKIKIILLIIEIILGILLSISSFAIIFILFKDNIINKKLISVVVEPIILLISIIGILPYKGKSCKKIVVALYLWEGLFLFPFSFYSNSGIKNANLYVIINRILFSRLCLLIIQFLNFIVSLVMKINI